MANTGLLRVGRPEHQLGRLTPSDLAPASSAIAPSTSVAPRVVLQYEDVYVTVPGEPAPAATVPPTVPATVATKSPSVKTTRKKKRPTAITTPTVKHGSATSEADNETHDGDEDDD